MTNANFFRTVANLVRPIIGMQSIPTPKVGSTKGKNLRTYYVCGGKVTGRKPQDVFTTVRAESLAAAIAMVG